MQLCQLPFPRSGGVGMVGRGRGVGGGRGKQRVCVWGGGGGGRTNGQNIAGRGTNKKCINNSGKCPTERRWGQYFLRVFCFFKLN